MSTSRVKERKAFIHLVRSGVRVARAAQSGGALTSLGLTNPIPIWEES